MSSETEIPRYYLGAIVGNGYLIPRDPMEPERVVYTRVLEAADAGDSMARTILDDIWFSEHERVYTRSILGIDADHASSSKDGVIILTPSHYPPTFHGKCIDQLQMLAQNGSYTAMRMIAWIARCRMMYPDFQLVDRG